MKTSPNSAAELLLRVRIATHQIEGARKQAASVYDEKLRTLRELDKQISRPETVEQPELFESSNFVNPEIEKLLYKNRSATATAAELLLRARIPTHQIEEARKQALSLYDERLRTLRDLDARLATLETAAQPELFDSAKFLSPDIAHLLRAPLAGLSVAA